VAFVLSVVCAKAWRKDAPDICRSPSQASPNSGMRKIAPETESVPANGATVSVCAAWPDYESGCGPAPIDTQGSLFKGVWKVSRTPVITTLSADRARKVRRTRCSRHEIRHAVSSGDRACRRNERVRGEPQAFEDSASK
jgi:hypothetical protein